LPSLVSGSNSTKDEAGAGDESEDELMPASKTKADARGIRPRGGQGRSRNSADGPDMKVMSRTERKEEKCSINRL